MYDKLNITETHFRVLSLFTKGFQGATGTITFNDKGSAPKEERIWQVQNGKEVLVG